MTTTLPVFFDHSRHTLWVRNLDAHPPFHDENRLRAPPQRRQENHLLPNATSRRYRIAMLGAVVGLLLAQSVQAGTLEAVNHTHWAINRFSVDGRSGIDIIGAYQGGGGGCCYSAPSRWQPGMTVRVDWETGASTASELADEFPGFADRPKYLAWVDKVEALKRKHSKIVPIPDYTGQKTCGLTVHFLPCDDIQVTTSCYAYGSPEYPIKTPLHLPEPQSCPK